MTVTLTADEIALLKGSDPNKRYMVVYNGTDETVYPALIGYDTNNKILTDVDADNLPSGFTLESKKYKILTFPKTVISGRIIARTGCKMVKGLYGDGLDGLLCDTGDCHQSYDPKSGNPADVTYKVSQKGLLCNVKGGAAPATVLEFSFTDKDFYDVSQVDGNNMSAQMEPILNQDPNVPSGTDKNYWCQAAGCTAKLDCPKELRVYDNNKKWIACQSIGAAISGIGTAADGGPQRYQGGTPPGPYSDFTGMLKETDPDSYNLLMKMYNVKYYWDANSPNKGGDPNRAWTKTGSWLPDADSTKCTDPSTCITAKTLLSCAADAGNSCGDPGAGKLPTFKVPDQGCSPNVTTYNTPDYAPHLCWSENWPQASDGSNYHKIFKDMCPNAYSWQFDDFSSTFTCNSSGPAPVHYFVQFYPYSGTPETINLGPSPPSPSPTPSPPDDKKDSWWTPLHISIIVGIVLLLLILVLKLAS